MSPDRWEPREGQSLWLLEIDELQKALEGRGNLDFRKVEKLIAEFSREPDPHDSQSSRQRLAETLHNAASLCQASAQTGNPIRLLW